MKLSRGFASLGLAVVMSGGLMVFDPMPAACSAGVQMLKDGTKVEIQGDQLFRWDNRGKRTQAPDGTYTLKSGKTITVKDGKIVHEKTKTEVPNLKK